MLQIKLKKKDTSSSNGHKVIQKHQKVSEFLADNNFNPDLIVMDIEGFEVDVIENLFLYKDLSIKPKILFEIHEEFYESPKDLEYLIGILNKNNYKCVRISSNLLCYQI